MNRESEEILLQDPNEEKEISPAMHERMLKGCLSSLFNHLKQENSFFSQLFAVVSQQLANGYWAEPKYECTFQKLVDSLKIFVSFVSLAVFKLFEGNNKIARGGLACPEELFLSPLLYSVFSKTTISRKTNGKLFWYSMSDIISSGLNMHNRDTAETFQGALMRNSSNFVINVPRLLKLDQDSIEEATRLSNYSLELPPFLKSITKIDDSGYKKKTIPFESCFKFLNRVVEAKSPIEKLFYLTAIVEEIPVELDLFYLGHGLETDFRLTEEEITQILIYLVCKSVDGDKLTFVLILVSLFVTQSIRIGKGGMCLKSFIGVHEKISKSALLM